jgi:hypothetical protein
MIYWKPSLHRLAVAQSPISTITVYSAILLHAVLSVFLTVDSSLKHWVIWVCCPSLNLGYRLQTADGPLPVFPNCPWDTTAATPDSLELGPITNTSAVHPVTDSSELSPITASKLYTMTDDQSASLSWCQALIWDSEPIFFSFFI